MRRAIRRNLTLAMVALILLLAIVPFVHALPGHEHGIPLGYEHGTVTWEPPPIDQIQSNPYGDTEHQHHDNDNVLANDKYTVWWGVWDDEAPVSKDQDPYPHGFISEGNNLWYDKVVEGEKDCVPDYYFDGDEWNTDENGTDVKDLVVSAFNKWGDINAWISTKNYSLITGIAFEETEVKANAEILVYWWDNITAKAVTTAPSFNDGVWDKKPLKIVFNSAYRDPWDFRLWSDPPPPSFGHVHFFSVALHEVGHIVGLDHSDSGVMNPTNLGLTGNSYKNLDANSIDAVQDLYSIPLTPSQPHGVGGIVISVDKIDLLAPYIGLASVVLATAAVATVYVKRVRHRQWRQ